MLFWGISSVVSLLSVPSQTTASSLPNVHTSTEVQQRLLLGTRQLLLLSKSVHMKKLNCSTNTLKVYYVKYFISQVPPKTLIVLHPPKKGNKTSKK